MPVCSTSRTWIAALWQSWLSKTWLKHVSSVHSLIHKIIGYHDLDRRDKRPGSVYKPVYKPVYDRPRSSKIVQDGPRWSTMCLLRSLRGALKIYKDCFQPSPCFAWNLNLSALFPVSCRSESVLRSKVQTLLTGDIPRRGQRTYCGKGLGTWSWPELNKRNIKKL